MTRLYWVGSSRTRVTQARHAASFFIQNVCSLDDTLTLTKIHFPPVVAPPRQALFESKWAESGLPFPGESQDTSHRRRAALRTARYRLCWRAQLRGPLREAARQAVRAASAAALAAGGPGAMEVSREFTEDILPMLSGEGEESNEEWTLGLFAERACLALGLRANQPPPAEEACPGAAAAAGGEKAGRDACADWLFGPRQAAWLAAETALAGEKRDPASAPPPVATASVVSAAWRALDGALSPATVLVASDAARGTPFSSVWARPDKLVWAKQAKNTFWPAMLLWGSGTTAALKEVNMGRVPPAFREELEKQVGGCVYMAAVFSIGSRHDRLGRTGRPTKITSVSARKNRGPFKKAKVLYGCGCVGVFYFYLFAILRKNWCCLFSLNDSVAAVS